MSVSGYHVGECPHTPQSKRTCPIKRSRQTRGPPRMADSSDQQHTSIRIQQVSELDGLDCVPAERRNCSTSSATNCSTHEEIDFHGLHKLKASPARLFDNSKPFNHETTHRCKRCNSSKGSVETMAGSCGLRMPFVHRAT